MRLAVSHEIGSCAASDLTLSSRISPSASRCLRSALALSQCDLHILFGTTDELEHLRSALPNRYSVERELGRGGMATVYLAFDENQKRQVAIKVLRSELAATLGVPRFLREIEITAKLVHPHILPLLESGKADDILYYVMPHVEGETLRDRLKREGQLPIEDAVKTTSEVADALAYGHSLGVIHRDIKPENIFLAAGQAVIGDFGIARAVSEAGGERLTETGLAMGTPAYMSPEQALGTRTRPM
ncbi:MAG: serine/threonine-protein kinase [Gemmatimonadales bacterium]